MPVTDHLEKHPGSWVEAWVGLRGLLLNPIYYSLLPANFARLYAVVVYEADKLQIDGPVIPVHAVISNEYVKSGDPEVVRVIRDEVLRLKELNPNLSIEYQPDVEVEKQFRQSAGRTSLPK